MFVHIEKEWIGISFCLCLSLAQTLMHTDTHIIHNMNFGIMQWKWWALGSEWKKTLFHTTLLINPQKVLPLMIISLGGCVIIRLTNSKNHVFKYITSRKPASETDGALDN